MIEQNETGDGRWVTDPDDPEFEKWEPTAGDESAELAGGEVERAKRPYVRNPDRVTCKARSKRTGDPCNNPPVGGATVCRMHGGAAPQVRNAARVRLEMAADRMAKQLLKMAADDDVADSVKLAAIKDALDRAGLSAKTAVQVEVGPTKEYEEILTAAMTGGSRAESRAARGAEDPAAPGWLAGELAEARAVAADADDYLDAEVVEMDDELASRPVPATLAPVPQRRSPEPANDGGMLSMEDALEQLRRSSPPPAPQGRRRRRA